jgi:hypothetical protein
MPIQVAAHRPQRLAALEVALVDAREDRERVVVATEHQCRHRQALEVVGLEPGALVGARERLVGIEPGAARKGVTGPLEPVDMCRSGTVGQWIARALSRAVQRRINGRPWTTSRGSGRTTRGGGLQAGVSPLTA